MPHGLTGASCSVGGSQRVLLPLQVSHLPAEGPANEVTGAGVGGVLRTHRELPGLGVVSKGSGVGGLATVLQFWLWV